MVSGHRDRNDNSVAAIQAQPLVASIVFGHTGGGIMGIEFHGRMHTW
jgi:hypothetical protein